MLLAITGVGVRMRSRQQAIFVGIDIEVCWADEDIFDVRVSAWNGSFGGTANLVVETGGLEKFAATVSGFPKDTKDVREVTLGTFSRDLAGGAVSMRFFCRDMAGHAYVQCRIESGLETAGVFQTATLVMPVEASAVDQFVTKLRNLEREKKGITV